MDKALFDQCIVNFNKIISNCHTYLDNLECKADIENLTLKQIQELKKFCVKEHSQQDKIFSEIRHLLGMGNLSPVQTSQLLKCYREYSSFRPDIKNIANHLNDINDIPNIPIKSEYELTVLGNFKLVSTLRCGKEELATTIKESSVDSIISTESEVSGGASGLELYSGYDEGSAIKFHNVEEDIVIILNALHNLNLTGCANKAIRDKIKKGGTLKNNTYEIIFKKADEDCYYLYMPHMVNVRAKRVFDRLIPYLESKKAFVVKY